MVSRIPYDLYGMYFLLEGMVKLTRSTSRLPAFFCRSQVIVLPIQKVPQTLVKANLRPS